MSTSSISVFLGLCLLFAGVNVSGKEQYANSAVADALSKIKTYPAYRLTRSLEAHLAPGTSCAMVPVEITETAVILVVHKDSVILAHETSTTWTRISPFRFFSRGDKETKTTLWDGTWIYSWGASNTGTKMVDTDINRGAAIMDNLYTALLKDESLRLRGEEPVDGQRCVSLETSAEFLTSFLSIPGKVSILISKETGFPVRISVQNEKSKTTVKYTAVDTNPTYQAQLFTLPSKVSFDTIKGQEDIPNGSQTNTAPVFPKSME